MAGLRALFRRRPAAAPELVDDGSLVTLARALGPAVGDAEVVRDAGLDAHPAVLVRHLFDLAPGADAAATRTELDKVLGPDGWSVGVAGPEPARLVAVSSRLLTPLGAAQARARMTGLESRLPVTYVGWEAAVPAPAPPPPD